MENTWDILTYLIDGCVISLLLFLIASVYIPALKNIRPAYLRIANTAFAIIGLVPLGISIYMYSYFVIDTYSNEIRRSLYYGARFILGGLLVLGIVPILALFRKYNTNIWFTFLLIVSIWAITHANAVAEWIALLALRGWFFHYGYEEPIIKWYRLVFALVFFLFCYWLTRRSVNRTSQS
ncbi:hypothetical protein HHL17_24090 [Chitinophaga sp. G-6-1-13]|uniref:Uncharacterized protein n=1 Tax=Chitinophaga fulva TaxID=2728842 RepID=A0A848GSG5_9BACT|nr:hypothetical protein [Chitinophaga fulva]NML40299.1 hypothetical protein [Chitinophaga fulva]